MSWDDVMYLFALVWLLPVLLIGALVIGVMFIHDSNVSHKWLRIGSYATVMLFLTAVSMVFPFYWSAV